MFPISDSSGYQAHRSCHPVMTERAKLALRTEATTSQSFRGSPPWISAVNRNAAPAACSASRTNMSSPTPCWSANSRRKRRSACRKKGWGDGGNWGVGCLCRIQTSSRSKSACAPIAFCSPKVGTRQQAVIPLPMSGYAMLLLSLMPKGVERASVGQVEIGPASSLGDARYWVSCLTTSAPQRAVLNVKDPTCQR